MKTYKYIFLLCLLALQSAGLLVAQNTMQQPTDLGNKAFAFIYTDTKNTANYTNDFQGQSSNDVFYKFTLTRAMDISIDHCGSGVYDTYLRVLNAAGQVIYSNDDDWEYQYCENPMNSYLFISNLPAGTYYVVSEGYSQNGNITTTIQGISPYSEIGSSTSIPIEIGSKTYSFVYSDTKNTTYYNNNFQGRPSNDVFYKFTLSRAMDVTIDHCGSGVNDTYLHLLNSLGVEIDYNDDDDDWENSYCTNSMHSHLVKSSLPAGDYYIVSEGYSQNGNITTTINGICPLPPTGLYDGSAVTSTANGGTNYVQTITPTIATSDVSGLGVNESMQAVQYFDGLGRPIQTVQRGITPSKSDLATYTEYDGVSRESVQWLPAPASGNNGGYLNFNTFKNKAVEQYGSDEKPYATTVYEPSPLNRVTDQYGTGKEWYNNTKRNTIAYETNTTEDNIAYFSVNVSNNLVRGSNYAASTLYKTVSKDEDGLTVEEYKDKLGELVLKRSKDGGENIDTYFVNNDLGQLSYVIPPKAADGLSSSGVYYDTNDFLKKFGYIYKYDERGNCISKRLPGCTPIFMVYDKADRLVLSQDGNQRKNISGSNRQWTATKYDVFGRVIFTGTMYRSETDTTTNYESIRDVFMNELVVGDYSAHNFSDCTPLTVNYYDNYSFLKPRSTLNFVSEPGYDAKHTSAVGMLTGSVVYELGHPYQSTTTVNYYDYRGWVVQTRNTNHLGGLDLLYNHYNFSGQVLQSLKKHTANGQTAITELYTNSYDHAGRLLKTRYKINEKTEVILNDMTEVGAYDEIGRLKKKRRHSINNGSTFQDSEEYDYNIRNWATRLKSGAFEEKLYYNTVPGYMAENSTKCFNGNITATTWTYNNATNGYQYNYDKLNRYVGGYAYLNNEIQIDYQMTESFVYDKQGNIRFLNRYGSGDLIDQLALTYNGNQLKSVQDGYGSQNQYNVKEYQDKASNDSEMAYDPNGNLIKDLDRDIVTIKYNLLNLPEIIQFKNGNQIVNTYDASGQKLKTRYYTVYNYATQPMVAENAIRNLQLNDEVYADGTDYVENVEYNYFAEYYSGELSSEENNFLRLNNPEGYCQDLNYSLFNYFRRDHLGNNREVWRAPWSHGSTNVAALTTQRTQYYPSGLPWASTSGDNPWEQNKKYNGKEFVEMHGYDTYDIVWRQYYPAIARFQTPDPEVEQFYDLSPYSMCGNNMVMNVDPDGRWAWAVGGAVLDWGFQVKDNYKSGKSGYNAWFGDVNFVSVGLSAINPTGKFKVLKTIAVEVVRAATENTTPNEGLQINNDIKEVGAKAALNVAVDVVASKVTDAGSNKAMQNANKEVDAANTQQKTAERQAQRSPNSTKKATNAQNTKSNLQVARNKQVRTKIINSTVGQAPKAVQQTIKTTTDRIKKNEERR